MYRTYENLLRIVCTVHIHRPLHKFIYLSKVQNVILDYLPLFIHVMSYRILFLLLTLANFYFHSVLSLNIFLSFWIFKSSFNKKRLKFMTNHRQNQHSLFLKNGKITTARIIIIIIIMKTGFIKNNKNKKLYHKITNTTTATLQSIFAILFRII